MIIAVFAALLFALFAFGFFPGFMSFDSAYQWWQARTGDTTDIAGIGIVLMWRLCDLVLDGPGGLFLAHLAMFWSGAWLVATAFDVGRARQALLLAALALLPPTWLLAHAWSDAGLLACLTLATGALTRAQARGDRRWILVAVPALFYAALLRHNALAAVLPLAYWCSRCYFQNEAKTASRRVALTTVAAMAALVVATGAVDRLAVRKHVTMLPSLVLWDLSGMSARADTLLVPPYAIDAKATVADLRETYQPYTNTSVLMSSRAALRDPFGSWPAPELHALMRDWAGAILAHPAAYLAHRAQLSRYLFWTRPTALPHELTFVPTLLEYRDNPKIAPNESALHRRWTALIGDLRATPAFAALTYLVPGVLVALLAGRARRTPGGVAGLTVLASAWLYALPLALIAPAAEFRYVLWPCVASALGIWLILAGTGRTERSVAAGDERH
jgi:hypothetical protein